MIHVPISIGELVDKITILHIKMQKIDNPEKLKNVQREYFVLALLPEYIAVKDQIVEETEELSRINAVLWRLEDDIRRFESDQSFDQVFINTARLIYKTNDDRSRVKKQINVKLNSELVEEKSYEDV
jgi:hypothetical protein